MHLSLTAMHQDYPLVNVYSDGIYQLGKVKFVVVVVHHLMSL